MSKIIVRSNTKGSIPDTLKYTLLSEYSQGLSTEEIANKHSLSLETVRDFIKITVSTLTAVRETRAMNIPALKLNTKQTVSTMNKDWMESVEQNVEMYAYHYATTGSNLFALQESGLDKNLPSKVTARAKKFIYSARGRFLRAIPDVLNMINTYRDQRVRDSNVGTSYIQSELIEQLEELKELVDDNPRNRSHILKTLELLGKSEGVFAETLNVNDTSAKTGMDALMDKIKERKTLEHKTKEETTPV